MSENNTDKFTGRSDDYVKYRPSYPVALLDAISERCPLRAGTMVADVGAGTGILSHTLLERGCTVLSVEPNADMRSAADEQLSKFGNALVLPGTGEATGLVAQSVDLVTVAQAFHWMSPLETRAEFSRILKPGGWVALIWNIRNVDIPFGAAYEEALTVCPNHHSHSHHTRTGDDTIAAFFGAGGFEQLTFENPQKLDLVGLLGRLRSTSYAPTPDDPLYEPLIEKVTAIFNEHADDGEVTFAYDTRLYIGQVA